MCIRDSLGAEHQGHGGAVNVQVHQTHGIAQLAQSHCQVGGNGGDVYKRQA